MVLEHMVPTLFPLFRHKSTPLSFFLLRLILFYLFPDTNTLFFFFFSFLLKFFSLIFLFLNFQECKRETKLSPFIFSLHPCTYAIYIYIYIRTPRMGRRLYFITVLEVCSRLALSSLFQHLNNRVWNTHVHTYVHEITPDVLFNRF